MRLLVLLLALAPAAALAAEGESMLSLTGSYGSFTHEPDGEDAVTGDGPTLQVEYERGLTDSLWLRGSAGGGVYFGDERHYGGFASLGFQYQLDILKYVPYVNFGVSGFYVTDIGFKPNLELGVGLDILRSRSFSYGITGRFEGFATDFRYLTVGLRASWRWGYF